MAINSWTSVYNVNDWRFCIRENKNHLKSLESDIDKIYFYAKGLCEAKYQFLTNKRESTGLKYLNDSKAFIEYSNDIDNIYRNIEENNPNKKRKILIAFDDMIADMHSNKSSIEMQLEDANLENTLGEDAKNELEKIKEI